MNKHVVDMKRKITEKDIQHFQELQISDNEESKKLASDFESIESEDISNS